MSRNNSLEVSKPVVSPIETAKDENDRFGNGACNEPQDNDDYAEVVANDVVIEDDDMSYFVEESHADEEEDDGDEYSINSFAYSDASEDSTIASFDDNDEDSLEELVTTEDAFFDVTCGWFGGVNDICNSSEDYNWKPCSQSKVRSFTLHDLKNCITKTIPKNHNEDSEIATRGKGGSLLLNSKRTPFMARYKVRNRKFIPTDDLQISTAYLVKLKEKNQLENSLKRARLKGRKEKVRIKREKDSNEKDDVLRTLNSRGLLYSSNSKNAACDAKKRKKKKKNRSKRVENSSSRKSKVKKKKDEQNSFPHENTREKVAKKNETNQLGESPQAKSDEK